ncbi:hypothetical protein F53441_8185 [Fusarium austroafricanum]|uniref:Amidohydrolase-related domain-containing protein n=1 Tax=Fusarium austroafricanum TaxID=2364996 RepID=A0A8H4KDE0_9HYPO|nr:hypothetical protein F53441_8185 [Fusarium austroafricanum]
MASLDLSNTDNLARYMGLTMDLDNIVLPFQDSSAQKWDIQIDDGVIVTKRPSAKTTATPSVLLPGLCHPHIHLDKTYLLTCNHSESSGHPDYSDLAPQSGTFEEAMSNTSEAKRRYTKEDLYLRGSQLLATSYKQGVTCARVFVEIDHVTELKTLKTAIRLKKEFGDFLSVQICAFAQDPIFSTEHGEKNRALLLKAMNYFQSDIDAIGTTPYAETNDEAEMKNVQWAIQTALKYDKHLDFHAEYNLNGGAVMDFFDYIVDQLLVQKWPTDTGARTVVLGHATRLTRASHAELTKFSKTLRSTKLPVHFVGLPTSDLLIMGRPIANDNSEQSEPLNRQCGTLHVRKLVQDYKLNACLSVNNVGNAFTPHGDGDPLGLASWGVGLYHAGRVEDAKLLYEAISTRAMDAIRPLDESHKKKYLVEEGKDFMPMLLVRNEESMEINSTWGGALKVPARQRLQIHDIVWDPPEIRLRSIIR